MKPCDSCAAGKAKQKNICKESDHQPAKNSNERIFLEIATLKSMPNGPTVTKPNWRIMVDERTQLKFSNFLDTKNGMIEPTCEQFQKWSQHGIPVKYVRCDNAGENMKLKTRCASADWKLGIEFEFTGRATPQRNHLAELAFSIIANRGRAMMHRANVSIEIRYKVWKEAFATATLLDGLTTITLDGTTATRYVHWNGHNPEFMKHLITWGAAGTVKTKTSTTPRVYDRGEQCMFVGYALDHSGDTYRMWNMMTNRVLVTRDIIWLKHMYFVTPIPGSEMVITPVIEKDTALNIKVGKSVGKEQEINVETVTEDDVDEDSDDDVTPKQGVTTRSGRTVKFNTR